MAALGLLATLALPAGCSIGDGSGGWASGSGEFTKFERASAAFTEPVTLRVSTRNGKIEVNEGGGEVRVAAVLRSDSEDRLEAARVVIDEQPDGTVSVYVDWPGGWSSQWEDRANIVVTLPAVASADLRSENGSVSVEGLSGLLDVDTRNGAVRVRDHDGPVRLKTVSGTISASGLTGAVVAECTNGAIDLNIPGATGPIDAQTTNGSVEITLGDAFRGLITLTTSNGGVETRRVERVSGEVLGLTPRSATVRFGGVEEPASTVRTSNGTVLLRGR